jgi:hypothetical protein
MHEDAIGMAFHLKTNRLSNMDLRQIELYVQVVMHDEYSHKQEQGASNNNGQLYNAWTSLDVENQT